MTVGSGVVLEQPPVGARASDSTDQEQFASGPSTLMPSAGRPSSRSMPSRSAAPWLTTTASCPSLEAAGDPGQRGAHALGDGGRRLAVGRVPGGALGRVALADLGVRQALPVAAGPLAQLLVRRDRQAGQPGERRGGLQRAGQVGGEDRIGSEGGEAARGVFGLRLAGLVERYVGLALEAVLGVPGRLAVPPQHEPLGCAQRYSPAPGLPMSAASGSSIRGQSFQMRSRA